MEPLQGSPDAFYTEHKGEAAAHSTHLWLHPAPQMGAHVGGNRAGKCIYLPRGPVCCRLSDGNPAGANVGVRSQRWGGGARRYPSCSRAPACSSWRRARSQGRALIQELKRSRGP